MSKRATRAAKPGSVAKDMTDAAAKVAVEADRYLAQKRRQPPPQRQGGIDVMVSMAFEQIAALRNEGLGWREVLEVIRRADLVLPTATEQQLRTAFNYQRRRRNGTLRRKGQAVGERSGEPGVAARSGATPGSPTRSETRARVARENPQADKALEKRDTARAAEAKPIRTIRLKDGRLIPEDQKLVRQFSDEDWDPSKRYEVYGDMPNAPLEPPWVPIETLMSEDEQ